MFKNIESELCRLHSNNNALKFADKCDGSLQCTDGSDEIGCCDENEIECDCVRKGNCNCGLTRGRRRCGCINKSEAAKSGFIQCPNERRITFAANGTINIYKLNNISECDEIGFPKCDSSTCYSLNYLTLANNTHASSRYQICTSFCSDQQYCRKKSAFRCSDNNYIFLDQFCDGIKDCDDGSDEIVEIMSKPGFKCNQCVLPQTNLYDNLAQCDDISDLCLFANNDPCFECLDKRLFISFKQVCDGVNDCYDLSDECLCENNFNAENCVSVFASKESSCFENSSKECVSSLIKIDISNHYSHKSDHYNVSCPTKYGLRTAILCDGRPECKDFRDECQCNNPPAFCNDPCHSSFQMGDRYCDGEEDPACIYLNNSVCPKGFDELDCPKRFKCNATGKVSIDIIQRCNGKPDCDDHSDEKNCFTEENEAIFSSDTEMIADPAIKAAFWIMGFIVLFSNAYVIVNTTQFLKTLNNFNFTVFQRVVILNISIADFIMGVYLLTIAVFSEIFSGSYGFVDREWRSSLRCSIIGSLSVISSQASCFFMVVLTAFRLMTISHPMKSVTSSLHPWKLCVVVVWLLSICLSIIPIVVSVTTFSLYFVHSISFSSRFHQNGTIDVAQLKRFMCRYALLSNTTLNDHENELESIQKFLESNLPDSLPVRRFGYYGETSVCMPRFYVARGEPSWEYTLSLITVNFLCFIFIALSYVVIYRLSAKSSANVLNDRFEQEAARMQKRIARIIATDFCCWIPICIMAYTRLAFDFSNIVYQISAAILLPVNSALNPFLFSSLPDKFLDVLSSQTSEILKIRQLIE